MENTRLLVSYGVSGGPARTRASTDYPLKECFSDTYVGKNRWKVQKFCWNWLASSTYICMRLQLPSTTRLRKHRSRSPKWLKQQYQLGKAKTARPPAKGCLGWHDGERLEKRRFDAVRCTCAVAGGLMRMCRERRGSTVTRGRISNYWRWCLY